MMKQTLHLSKCTQFISQTLLLLLLGCLPLMAVQLVNDSFDYPPGNLLPNTGGSWVAQYGMGDTPIQVLSTSLDGTGNSVRVQPAVIQAISDERARHPFPAQPAGTVIYYGFAVLIEPATLANGQTEGQFACIGDNNSLRGLVMAQPSDTGGDFDFAITPSGGVNPVKSGKTLFFNTPYLVVVKYTTVTTGDMELFVFEGAIPPTEPAPDAVIAGNSPVNAINVYLPQQSNGAAAQLDVYFAGTEWADAVATLAPPPGDVPTLGQWGIILFTLLLLTLSTVAIVQRQSATASPSNNYSLNIRHLPLNKGLFMRLLAGVLVAAFAVFGLAIALFGYELTGADVPGTLVCAPILAYLLSLA